MLNGNFGIIYSKKNTHCVKDEACYGINPIKIVNNVRLNYIVT
jgi:hypothetical protein